jgi:redox-sensitive bicupin YhaK (pirin superfamily)
LVLKPHHPLTVTAGGSGATVMLLGGEPMDGPRHLVWNFVSSSEERIEQAKRDWIAQRFAPVPEETEWIPLPDNLKPAD